MTQYKVTLYNTILEHIYVDAVDGDAAAEWAWSHGGAELDLPEGFSLSDPTAWELDDVQEVD
jgi:hypothetical protein